MNCNGLDAHLAAGALNAQGDFATIGDEDFFEHDGCWLRFRRYAHDSAFQQAGLRLACNRLLAFALLGGRFFLNHG